MALSGVAWLFVTLQPEMLRLSARSEIRDGRILRSEV